MEQVVLMPHQKRLLTERSQLADKVAKLTNFISHGELFPKLDEYQQELMREQCESMCKYLEVLDIRISITIDSNHEPQNKVEYSHVQSLVESLEYKFERVGDTTVTGCWAFLPSGFQVGYGESACVDPNEYKREDGEKYAKERCIVNATNKLWELEGYLLAVTGATSDRH